MKKVFLLFLFIGILVLGWYKLSLRPIDGGSESRVHLTIPVGATTTSIASMLANEDVIRSEAAFRVHVRLSGNDGKLQAGTFVLQRSASVQEVVESLKAGKAEEASVTIPEGYTVKDIDALMAELGFINGGEIIDCAQTCDFATFDFLPLKHQKSLADRGGLLEGYLYPETYFVAYQDFHPKFFLERMLGEFRRNVIGEYAGEIVDSPYSLHEIVTMASLVEEETRADEERPIVAGILWKRLREGFRLDVDATVRYIVDKPTDAITLGDLNIQSPYNTRKLGGLPPGPIANPGLKSLEATLQPESSKYYYYLHGKDGKIRYAVSNEEHNINKYRYIRN